MPDRQRLMRVAHERQPDALLDRERSRPELDTSAEQLPGQTSPILTRRLQANDLKRAETRAPGEQQSQTPCSRASLKVVAAEARG